MVEQQKTSSQRHTWLSVLWIVGFLPLGLAWTRSSPQMLNFGDDSHFAKWAAGAQWVANRCDAYSNCAAC